jgi:hypothetical protein
MALTSYSSRSPFANAIDTYRCFLDDVDVVGEFNRTDGFYSVLGYSTFTADEAQWLWQKNLELSVGEDLRSNQRVMIRRLWSIIGFTDYGLHRELQFPIMPMDKDILSDIQYGRCEIFGVLFSGCQTAMRSYILGAWFLQWLTSLQLDPEICVASELANLGRWLSFANKRVVFERNWDQNWILGLEWVLDHEAPGYSLLFEYPTLTIEADWTPSWTFGWPPDWPLAEWKYVYAQHLENWGCRISRFNRRTAAKERKERARLGQKQPRSRMPGTWNW